jgi:phosphoglycerate dehydrogenase-like enzyme
MKILFLGPTSHLAMVKKMLSGYDILFAQNDIEVDLAIEECEVIFDAYMKVPFREERLTKALKLKLFITATTGASHIDTAFLETHAIPLFTLKGQEHITNDLTAAAEHTWLLLMAVARQLVVACQEPLNGEWDRNKYPGVMLKGKKLGVVGCGRIGGWICRYGKAFGMEVLGYDPIKTPDAELFISSTLDELLGTADFITIHVPLNPETKLLLDATHLSKIKKGAVLINTSRGELIDEACLLELLNNKHLSGAGLDVLTNEPDIKDDPLVSYARSNHNLIITPHIGGFSPDALDVVIRFSCSRIKDFFNE